MTENWTMLERVTERELKLLCMYRLCNEDWRRLLQEAAMDAARKADAQRQASSPPSSAPPRPSGRRRRLPSNVIAFPVGGTMHRRRP